MKIGVIASFFETRTDIFRMVDHWSKEHEIVLFILPKDKKLLEGIYKEHLAIRVISERKTGWMNFLSERLFLLAKRIPKSKTNYYLMELFKASNLPDPQQRKKALGIVTMQKRIPRYVSYNWLLKTLRPSRQTCMDDIDLFIGLTEPTDDYFYARLVQERKQLHMYVYSWDHACKQTRFFSAADYYVWNAGIREDMIELQHIRPERIKISGSSQFTFIYDYLQKAKPVVKDIPYIYFGCAIGIAGLIEKEVELIGKLAAALSTIHPNWRMVVRPYPNLKNWDYYAPLSRLSNVFMDDGFRNEDGSVKASKIEDKFSAIQNAMAFIHTGSTLGLEACYFDTPVLVADLYPDTEGDLSIYHFVHQYQNDKYFNHPYPDNMIRSVEQFKHILSNLQDPIYKKPNREIPQQFPLMSIESFSETLLH